MDQDLSQLIARGTKDGYLTYDEVNAYLPDEDVNPEKLSKLLLALEKYQIKLVEKPAAPLSPKRAPEPNVREMRSSESAGEADVSLVPADFPKASEDPIRMYLSQMAEIPVSYTHLTLPTKA